MYITYWVNTLTLYIPLMWVYTLTLHIPLMWVDMVALHIPLTWVKMLTLHYPLEVDHSLTRRWPEKTCFRMLGRAISEYVVSYTIGTDMLQHVNMLTLHIPLTWVNMLTLRIQFESTYWICTFQRSFVHQTLAREYVLSNAGSHYKWACRLIHARHIHVATCLKWLGNSLHFRPLLFMT